MVLDLMLQESKHASDIGVSNAMYDYLLHVNYVSTQCTFYLDILQTNLMSDKLSAMVKETKIFYSNLHQNPAYLDFSSVNLTGPLHASFSEIAVTSKNDNLNQYM